VGRGINTLVVQAEAHRFLRFSLFFFVAGRATWSSLEPRLPPDGSVACRGIHLDALLSSWGKLQFILFQFEFST